ncbi:MAG: hypothetical protein ACTSXL_05810 [Alphaproteobacteria bacterium]
MAKKRNKKKKIVKSKKLATKIADISSEISEMKKLVALGSLRKATTIASAWVSKSDLTEVNINQIIETLLSRLFEMVSNNQASKAAEKLENIFKQRPEWLEKFPKNLLLKLDLEGGADFIIKNYKTDSQSTKIVDDYIQNKLNDIRPLSVHKKLSEDHLLKKQGRTLLAAWEEIETKTDSTEKFDLMLKTIGRKSPFVGWRLFVQALNCWYKDQDEKALRFLNKSASFECIKSIAQILRNLIAKEKMGTEAGLNVERKMRVDSSYHELCKLERLLKDPPSASTARKLVDFIKNPVYPEMPLLHLEMSAIAFDPYFDFDEMDDETIYWAFEDLIINKQINEIISRVCIIANSYNEKNWIERLEKNENEFSKIEKSLVLFWLAEYRMSLIRDAIEEKQTEIGINIPFSDELCAMADKEEVKQIIKYLEGSIVYHPTKDAYKMKYKFLKVSGSSFQSCLFLKSWINEFPDDDEPLFNLLNIYKKDKKYSKALKILEKSEKIVVGNSKFDSLKCSIIFNYASELLFKNKNKKVVKLIEDIPSKVSDYNKTISAVLRWFAEKNKGNFKIIQTFNQPLSVEVICKHLKREKPKFDIKDLLLLNKVAMEDYKTVINNFLLFKKLRKEEWNPLQHHLNSDLMEKVFRKEANSIETIKLCLELVAYINIKDKKLIWLLTGKGLNVGKSSLGFFLALRAVVIDKADMKRSIDCLSAARFIAGNEKDKLAFAHINAVENFLDIDCDDINETISKKVVDDIIEFEKQFDCPKGNRFKRNTKKVKKKSVIKKL